MSKFGNSLWNTVAVPVRWVGTLLNTWWDVIKTWWNVFSDMWKVISDTGKKTWETLSSSWSSWKWYNKLYQVPAGIAISWATIVEWAVRTVVDFFKNIWNTIKRAFDTTTPVSDFSYEKLKLKEPTRKNRVSKLAWWKK